MAAQTVSTSKNYDDASIAGLANGDTITVDSGATLTVNSDSRWGQQAAFWGSLTLSSVTGGTALLDGRDVWWVPYDGGTGNVPALGTVGVNDVTGGVAGAGEFLGVFTALGVAPSAAASAMPATGFIKLRRYTAAFADNEVMTFTGGATATVNSATGGQRGWIHVVGTELGTCTVPRLGTFQVRGDWFELGTTSGVSDQTFNFPVADVCPAMWVETGPGTNVFEKWLNAGNRFGAAIVVISQDVRGKFFGCTTAGLITIARTTTNACGYLPPAGCRVRIPNVICSSSTVAAPTVNTQHTTVASRFDFSTSSAGVIDLEYMSCNWYLSLANVYSFTMTHCSAADQIAPSECATPFMLTDVAIAWLIALNVPALLVDRCPEGGTISDCRMARYGSTSGTIHVAPLTDVFNCTIVNSAFEVLPATTGAVHGIAATYGINASRCVDMVITNCVHIGCKLQLATSSRVTITGFQYADIHLGATSTTVPFYAYSVVSQSSDVSIDGFSSWAGLTNVHPYSGIADVSNSQRVKLRNIGSPGSPYNCGSALACGVIFQEANNVDTYYQRIWTINARLGAATLTNESKRTKMTNVQSNGANTFVWVTSEGTALSIRNSNSTTGQAACYGSHWMSLFDTDTTGRLVVQGNEPNSVTLNTQFTITAGTPRFSGGGSLVMPTLGDQVVYETPRKLLGHTGFANIAPTYTGTGNGTNITWEYALDTGAGYGAWKALSGANLSAETISSTAGFMMKWRATTVIANSTNIASYTRINTITTLADQQTLYPLADPTVGYSSTQTGSVLSVWDDTTSTLLASGVYAAGLTTANPPWSANYNAVMRLRKPGWTIIENTISVVEDGLTLLAAQLDTAVVDTDPGALGITVTDHGATPVSWQGKNWSITITTTNDALTVADVCNYINYNTSQLATFNGYVGHAWPEMVQPDGAGCKTLRGRLMGSAGAALKGVRVVRSDGTTAVVGFTTMMADDGTTYTVPTISSVNISGYTVGSRIAVINVTTSTVVYNNVPGGATLVLTYVDGTDFTTGDSYAVRIAYQNGVTANVEEEYTGVVSSSGFAVVDDVAVDDVYVAYGVDGSTCTEFTWDGANLQADINDANNTTEIQRIGAWYHYYITTATGIIDVFGGIQWNKINEVLIDTTVVDMKLDNTKVQPLMVTGGRLYRSDATTVIAAASNSIHIDYDPVYAIGLDTVGADVWATPLEGATTAGQLVKLQSAVLLGKSSGQPGSPVYRDVNDTANRVSGTVDGNGNRTAVTLIP